MNSSLHNSAAQNVVALLAQRRRNAKSLYGVHDMFFLFFWYIDEMQSHYNKFTHTIQVRKPVFELRS
jgi:hypothetical protein